MFSLAKKQLLNLALIQMLLIANISRNQKQNSKEMKNTAENAHKRHKFADDWFNFELNMRQSGKLNETNTHDRNSPSAESTADNNDLKNVRHFSERVAFFAIV